MFNSKVRWLSILAALVMLLTMLPSAGVSMAQGASRTFPETGKTVKGRFLEYWDTHGGLAQQGYPITEERPEVSATDGKTYTVQYFERAVFEAHPEFARPNDVLLSLLGVFRYQKKYPSGAPNQQPNNEAGSRLFTETGKRVGGLFLNYWNTHGGLAQQGFPISDEFVEVSDLNGQSYKVQYFERAVFEFHPENPAPFNVLLSQLGTIRLREVEQPPTPVVPPTNTPGAVQPTATPVPTQPPPPTAPPPARCDVSGNRNGEATPSYGKQGDFLVFRARGFVPNEDVSLWFTSPSGIVVGTAEPVPGGVNPDGTIGPILWGIGEYPILPSIFGYGRWALTFQGASGTQALIFFCVEQ